MARRVQVHNNCIFFFQTRHERVQWPSGANLEEAENNATSRLLLQPFLAWIKVTNQRGYAQNALQREWGNFPFAN